ncbi:hypothetical protein MKEN_00265600 [Mycena kentingensis (nom. inval.)]|nr:hypothetical protein MKEN_00265600 [Mycena kentingensis (nom. inval.)]
MSSSDSPPPVPAAASSPPPAPASPTPVLARPSLTVATSASPFYRADSTFNPAPYFPMRTNPIYPPHPSIAPPPVPTSNLFEKPPVSGGPPFDGMLIHPPFTVLPDNVVLNEPMSYMVLHNHPAWFLDIRDYITLEGAPPGAIRYPRDLEPPRPRRQKDLLLRCTFCPRTYAGVNAKSMWTRHVREKHRVVLSKAWTDSATTSTARRMSTPGAPATPVGAASPSASPSSPSISKPPPLPLPKPAPTALTTTAPLPVPTIPKVIIPARPPATTIAPIQTAPSVSNPLPLPVRAKPGPKPKPKPASPSKPASTAGGSPAKPAPRPRGRPPKYPRPAPVPRSAAPSSSATPTTRSTPTPEPEEELSGWVRTDSPPPPEGMLPPRMRPAARLSFRMSQGPLELKKAMFANSSVSRPNSPGSASRPPSPRKASVARDIDNDSQSDNEQVAQMLMEVDDSLALDVDMDIDNEPEVGVVSGEGMPSTANAGDIIPGGPSQDTEMELETPPPQDELEEDTGPPPLGVFSVGSLAYLTDKNLVVTPPASPQLTASSRLPLAFDLNSSSGAETPLRNSGSDADAQSSGVLTPNALPRLFAATEDVLVLRTERMDRATKKRLVGALKEFGVDIRGGEEDMDVDADVDDDGVWAGLPPRAVEHMMTTPSLGFLGSGARAAAAMTKPELSPELAKIQKEFVERTSSAAKEQLAELSANAFGRRSGSGGGILNSNGNSHAPASPSPLSTSFLPAAADNQEADSISTLIATELAQPICAALTEQLADAILQLAGEAISEAMEIAGGEACVEWEWRGRVLERERAAGEGEENADAAAGQDVEVIQHPLHHLLAL